jgi:solute carrier family 45 protein 1/2/4
MVGVAVPLTLGIGAAGAWGFCALCRCHRDRLQRKERESPNLMMSYRMWVVAFSSFGIGYTWAMQFCRGTGLFKALGLSDNQLMFVFLPGSLIGLFVQPILGIFSDNHRSRYGRRRPFIFAGAILLAVAYGLLANAYSIGNAFGDSEAVSRPSDIRPVGAGVAIVSFWVADFAINAAQLPCRVLATDIVEESLQEAVMARFSITDNAGKVVACEW